MFHPISSALLAGLQINVSLGHHRKHRIINSQAVAAKERTSMQLHTRPLFGGYSLAIDDTVFAMVAEGNIYLKACEQSAAYRVEHRNPLLTLRP